MDGTDTQAGTRLGDTVEMDLNWLAGGWLTPEVLAADARTYARIQAHCSAVLVEASAVAVVFDPDEPVPFWLTMAGGIAAGADETSSFPPGDDEAEEDEEGGESGESGESGDWRFLAKGE
jgi:hypothetical protein